MPVYPRPDENLLLLALSDMVYTLMNGFYYADTKVLIKCNAITGFDVILRLCETALG